MALRSAVKPSKDFDLGCRDSKDKVVGQTDRNKPSFEI